MTTKEPIWLQEARKHLGLREIKGPASEPRIRALWNRLKGGGWFWKTYGEDDSKLPWCGAFIAGCFDAVGLPYAKSYASAKGWLEWGVALPKPCVGCIVVLSREGGGHVFIATAIDQRGRIVGIGGNQGDAVTEAAFDAARVVGYRWPASHPIPASLTLPVVAHAGASSANEA